MADPIIIVGAGVAGLALALALKRVGIDAVVLERRPELSVEGAGIQIGPNGTHVLRHLGVFDACAAHASVPRAIVVHDGVSGRELTQLPLGDWIAQRHRSPYWVIHRIDLVRALYHEVRDAGVDVRFGVDVITTTASHDDVAVSLADGTVIKGSGLVGADGVWSGVRAQHFADAPPTATGRVAFRATVAGPDLACIRRDAVSLWMAPQTHLVTYPIQRGENLNVVLIVHGTQTAAHWSEPVDARDADLERNFATFPVPVRALQHVAGPWRRWPLLKRAPLASYARGTVAVAGDAAHPMLPFLAQGAVMALEDAVVLAHALTRDGTDVAGGFARYSSIRRARAERVVRTAARNGHIYHMDGAGAVARNAVLYLSPAQTIMRGYDWLYGGAREVLA